MKNKNKEENATLKAAIKDDEERAVYIYIYIYVEKKEKKIYF